jgi:hypothetical protein
LAQPSRFLSKDPGLVEGSRGPLWLQDVQIPAKVKKPQTNSQILEQANLWQYIRLPKAVVRTNEGDSKSDLVARVNG